MQHSPHVLNVARMRETEQLVQLDLLLPASLFRHMAEQYALERATALETVAAGHEPAMRYQNFNDYLVETLKDVFFGAHLWGPEEDRS